MWFKLVLYKLAPRNWHNVRYIFGPVIGCAYYDWHVRTCREIADWHLRQARWLNPDFDRELRELRQERRQRQRAASRKPDAYVGAEA